MKVYKYELSIYENDEGEIVAPFSCTVKTDFKYNCSARRWIRTVSGGWVAEIIPQDAELERRLTGGLKVVQGFEKKLSKSEEEKLHTELKSMLRDFIVAESQLINYMIYKCIH